MAQPTSYSDRLKTLFRFSIQLALAISLSVGPVFADGSSDDEPNDDEASVQAVVQKNPSSTAHEAEEYNNPFKSLPHELMFGILTYALIDKDGNFSPKNCQNIRLVCQYVNECIANDQILRNRVECAPLVGGLAIVTSHLQPNLFHLTELLKKGPQKIKDAYCDWYIRFCNGLAEQNLTHFFSVPPPL